MGMGYGVGGSGDGESWSWGFRARRGLEWGWGVAEWETQGMDGKSGVGMGGSWSGGSQGMEDRGVGNPEGGERWSLDGGSLSGGLLGCVCVRGSSAHAGAGRQARGT